MVAVIIAALIGVLAGLFAKRRLFAIPIAVAVSLALHGLAILTQGLIDPEGAFAGVRLGLAQAAGSDMSGLLISFTAAGVGAILAALLWSMMVGLPTNEFWFPSEGVQRARGKDGRYARTPGMVEDRAVHSAAKARLDDLLQR